MVRVKSHLSFLAFIHHWMNTSLIQFPLIYPSSATKMAQIYPSCSLSFTSQRKEKLHFTNSFFFREAKKISEKITLFSENYEKFQND